ncbi:MULTISPECIES: magnesium protoporphyrin IX methyltransferase [Methylobacterium]|uniref:Magnesium protoporphyrin IX methyltransferase n=1 Tax=Methylobacterium jeotgali TaxID=381630 RepID=A0ABQ4ST36_9HYPH|nr:MULTISPECIES: magnesium protoporphyrin IX methyltransferase [Methylobacterium]PIU04087.1 MAG: magnesium protoporphyrin IX methyltransferase [Methylobacterium sp. CG09_land_8_20_14_0_10_71_15]PIU11625.1 MAG: magnesium protoporphyrin IX methyltransferase [Methylobacterium sp. CG08_land_8_20_14_0_20_71_15]GBU17620.1 magnesium protoporphyrin IX methyltransferase [Methylobacterium sp.]GJE04988.1 Magnesium-protoporphyrin O-methyltransferase [Methylobacterium jeotgali]
MTSPSYAERRSELTTYFDRTAVEAWARLTSDAPVSKIRATVRAGREAMRETLLSWLPADLRGRRVLDAGCGTGALSLEAARRGAEVVAVDVSPTLIDLARERTAPLAEGCIDFRVGDMLDAGLGRFDHVVAMDSLIHYGAADIARALAELSRRTETSLVFTVAPRTALLTLMHAAGRLFPRRDRAPAIVPITEAALRRRIAREGMLDAFALTRTRRIDSGFYLSNAIELTRALPPPAAGEGGVRRATGEGSDASGDGAPLIRPASRAAVSRRGEKGGAP